MSHEDEIDLHEIYPNVLRGSERVVKKYRPLVERHRGRTNEAESFTLSEEPLEILAAAEESVKSLEKLVVLLSDILSESQNSNQRIHPVWDHHFNGKLNSFNSVDNISRDRSSGVLSRNFGNLRIISSVIQSAWTHLSRGQGASVWNGSTIGSEEIDGALETLTIVNALLLSVPFQSIGNIGFSFWDWLEKTLNTCASGGTDGTWFYIYSYMENALYTCVYSAITSILIAILYFILRPTQVTAFHKWWRKGRYVVLLMLLTTVSSVLAALTVFTFFTGAYVNSTQNLCSTYGDGGSAVSHYHTTYIVALSLIGVALFMSFVLLF